jgi:hypothetical protein
VHALTAFLASGAPAHGEAAPGDHLQTGYRLWLAGHQLEHGQQPWIDPYSFHPEAEQVNPAWWPYGLPYWPFVRLLGPVLAWNLFTLVCLFGAGALTLLWLRELGISRFAAAAGGLVYEVAPYRIVQSRGHLLGPISLLLPLALWTFERAHRTGRQRWWWASWAALVSIPLSGQVHLALGVIPFYVLYGICRSRRARDVIQTVIGAVAAVLAGVLIDQTVIKGSIDSGGRSLKEVNVYSATGVDFVSRHVGGNAETFVFLGWLTPIVAIGGLILLSRRDRWLASGLGIGAVVPIQLAFGTHNPLYGPLWHAFPPLRYPRVPERLMPIACLAIGALVAVAIDWGLKRREARRIPQLALAAIVVVVLLGDLHVRAFGASAADGENAAYDAVRDAPKGRLLELPVFLPDIHFGSVYLYYNQRVQRERPLGYSTTAPKRTDVVARHLEPLNCGDWTTGVDSRLKILKVSSLTLHQGLFVDNPFLPNAAWMAWRGLVAHGWRPVRTDGPITAFVRGTSRAKPPVREPSRNAALFCQGWFPPDAAGRQASSSHAALWAHGPGFARFFVMAPEPLPVTVSLGGRPHTRLVVEKLTEIRIDLASDRWYLVSLDSPHLPIVRGKPRGVRIVAYSLP